VTSISTRNLLVGVAIGVAAAALALGATRAPLLQHLENFSYDLRVRVMARPAAASSPIVIVEIDDSTVRGLAPVVGRWPWPRFVHAAVIDFLKQAGARVIAYDVLLGEPEGHAEVVVNGRRIAGDESDAALVTSVRNAGNVVLLADATTDDLAGAAGQTSVAPELPGVIFHPGAGFDERPRLDLPFHDLAGVALALGHNRLVKDDNTDFARRMLPFVEAGGTAVPSLGLAAALAFAGATDADVRVEAGDLRVGARRVPLLHEPVRREDGTVRPSSQALLRFTEPVIVDEVRSIYPTYSFFDVALSADNVASGKPPAIPLSAFKDKLVFVGTSAAGLYDRYASPFRGGLAGVELHATFADNILSGAFMRRAPLGVDLAWSTMIGMATGLAAAVFPVGLAFATCLGLVAAFASWATREVGVGVWVAAVMPALAAAFALFGGVAWRYFVEDRARRHLRHLFGRYVSGDVIDELVANPGLARLGGQRREMTVLFSDIRGFTTASERSSPEEVVAQLNEYFGAMVEVLFRHHGTLDKFVGDMVMGLFGAPVPDPRHADHAVLTALAMVERLEVLNRTWAAAGRSPLDIGIGINTGEMIAGNIGAESAMSYTVIGDAVNLGSRLESLNKDYGTRILISDRTRAALTIAVETRFIGDVQVKGKTQPVGVHELIGVKERT
jgi:adenylate cyclase